VRKTAAICVAKLYDINPELVEERGFLDILRELVGDANPMVVANAVAALAEVADASGKRDVFPITSAVLFKLLAALNECTEWGQVFILDALAGYPTDNAADAEAIVERVTPRLQHANCAVVLSAVKVALKQLPLLAGNAELLASLRKKLAPPLVTLLSAEPEIQYVALRNINLIIQRYPSILGNEVKVFFCKYNDPLYVKMEKLEIMVRLVSDKNVDAVLLEWREYATEVDVDFVRKAVRAIGRAAIALPAGAERCVGVLLDLIQTKVSYVVQEAVIVIRDIFRRYPGTYEGVIGTLCECLDTLDEPEAKASMVWIVGEYAERIDNAEELLSMFAETFEEEAAPVQLQLLTAVVKLFLKKPEAGPQALIQAVLGKATTETDNPDLRDRAYIYWRLLAADPEAARDVVLADKPVIADDAAALEPALLDELLGQVATLASVYHKPADAFVSRTRVQTQGVGLGEGGEEEEEGAASGSGAAGGYAAQAVHVQQHAPPPPPPPPPAADLLGDLMGLEAPVRVPFCAAVCARARALLRCAFFVPMLRISHSRSFLTFHPFFFCFAGAGCVRCAVWRRGSAWRLALSRHRRRQRAASSSAAAAGARAAARAARCAWPGCGAARVRGHWRAGDQRRCCAHG
jgi:AP-1 complex subunit beta-1